MTLKDFKVGDKVKIKDTDIIVTIVSTNAIDNNDTALLYEDEIEKIED